MGLWTKLAYGSDSPVITAKLIFKDTTYWECELEVEKRAVHRNDFIALVLFQYAKMLAIVPNNYFGTEPYIAKMAKITALPNFKLNLLLGFNSIAGELKLQDARESPKNRLYRSRLFRDSNDHRSLVTDIPAFGPTSQALLSINGIASGAAEYLSDDDIGIMARALNLMSAGYLSGVNSRSLISVGKVPVEALKTALELYPQT